MNQVGLDYFVFNFVSAAVKLIMTSGSYGSRIKIDAAYTILTFNLFHPVENKVDVAAAVAYIPSPLSRYGA